MKNCYSVYCYRLSTKITGEQDCLQTVFTEHEKTDFSVSAGCMRVYQAWRNELD